MKSVFIAVMAASLLVAVGCKSASSSNSKIVAEVEAAGSGSLEGLDEAAIQSWLAKHDDVAAKIGPECSVVMKTASADWANTTEGVVCTAVARVLFYKPKDLFNGQYAQPQPKQQSTK